ncbi:unnamed protein product [Linum tenue]|uniref:Uncharacterized protein n=1 Tax=Linum tenue TaxID=586396 RepID=A0AAV0JIM3_9ROSI|nr:unnamed protein product [Linum tenue]
MWTLLWFHITAGSIPMSSLGTSALKQSAPNWWSGLRDA